MELEECENNFNYDGEPFDIHLKSTKNVVRGMYWLPKNSTIKRIIIFVHGMNASIVSERDSATFYNQRETAFFGADHIGHGKSDGFPASCSIEEIIEETVEIVKLAHKLYPNIPIYLQGHSLGGLTVVGATLLHSDILLQNNVKGIIVIAPFMSACPKQPLSIYISTILYILYKLYPLCKLPMGSMAFDESVPKEYVEKITSHSKADGFVTARMLMSCYIMVSKLQGLASKWPKNLPMLFEQGDSDELVTANINIDFAKEIQELGVPVTICVYKNAGHQVLRSKVRGQCLRDILSFIDKLEK